MHNFENNRKYFFLAVNTGFVATGGAPDARCRDFYRARSGNGLHCAIVGNVVTPSGAGSNEVCARISEAIEWRDLADAIADEGAIAGIQLASAWPTYRGMTRFVPNRGEDPIIEYRKVAASISREAVDAAFDGIYRGTEIAVKAGYRHVQIHAAHGYLFNLLIDPLFSCYADISAKKIRRWAHELKSMGVETSIRFSMLTGDAVLDEARGHELVDHIASLPVDYIDVSAGFYNINKRLIYPSTPQLLSERIAATLEFAQRHRDVQVILSGRSSYAWNESLRSNVHIGICRDLIANPNFLRERTGGCTLCMKCHYYSRGESHLTCGRWNDGSSNEAKDAQD
ncbi:hypothetical protein LJR029_006357 [Caballeronia sp. LjRoot29]|uniref:oxidoreductase n=1 Tax=Caballeronia sp. LjRoot29 TaxID=3342315 RepID=UPI003ED0E11C